MTVERKTLGHIGNTSKNSMRRGKRGNCRGKEGKGLTSPIRLDVETSLRCRTCPWRAVVASIEGLASTAGALDAGAFTTPLEVRLDALERWGLSARATLLGGLAEVEALAASLADELESIRGVTGRASGWPRRAIPSSAAFSLVEAKSVDAAPADEKAEVWDIVTAEGSRVALGASEEALVNAMDAA